MATTTEEIQYIWKGNNKEAINAIAELELKNQNLKDSIDELKRKQEILRLDGKKSTSEYKENKKVLDESTAAYKRNSIAIADQRKEVGLLGMSNNQLKRYLKETKTEEDKLTFGSEAYNKVLERRISIQKELARRNTVNAPAKGILDQISSQMPAALAGGIAGGMVGFGIAGLSALGDGLRRVIPPMRELADANSDLKIALNLTDEEVQKLNQDIRNINTRTAISDLKEIGQVAGDLNVPTEQVKGFIEETDKGAVVFKRSFQSAEEYATSIGKLKGMYKEFKDEQYGKAINDIGSAMKVLEDDGPATAKGILEFTTRIGQLPESLRPAISETMAYAAVMEEAGLTAEISSGGLSNILLVASKNAAAFAKFLGMTTVEFKGLLNTNPNAVIMQLAEGFKGLTNTQVGQVMKGLKIESQESIKVLGTLADNTDKLTQKQQLSNQALAEGTRITEIFNEKNDNFGGKIDRIGKRISEFTNYILTPFRVGLEQVITDFGYMIGAFDKASDSQKPLIDQYNELTTKVQNYDKNLIPLLNRYDQLKAKTSPTKAEQDELRKVIDEIARITPVAIEKIDTYGRAMTINTDKTRGFVDMLRSEADAIKQLTKEALYFEILEKEKRRDFLGKKLEDINKNFKVTKDGYVKDQSGMFGAGSKLSNEMKYTIQDITQMREEYGNLGQSIQNLSNQFEDLTSKKYEKTNTTKPTNNGFKDVVISGETDNEANRKANEKLKRIAEENQKLLDAQIEAAHQQQIQMLDDESKKITLVEQSAEKRLQQLTQQFKNENGLVLEQSKWSQEQKNIYSLQEQNIQREAEEKITEIQAEFAKKRADQLLSEQQKAAELARSANLQLAQAKLEDAQRGADDLAVFNAKFDLLVAQEQVEQAKLSDSYLKKQDELKGNNEALKALDENYYNESNLLTDKYLNQQTALFQDYYKAHQERKQKANIESLKLDIEEAKGTGIGAERNAKIALLNAEMNAELSVKNITEEEKTNIVRKYALQRKEIELSSQKQIANAVVDYFGQAYAIFSQFQNTKIQNETQAEDASNKKRLDNLEKQKEKGVLTAEQYTAKKTQLEAQHDKKTRELQRKQAILNKQNQTIQASMALAKSIIEVSGTPWMIPIVSALGLAQIAAIQATEIPAYYTGGYTDKPERKMSSFSKPTATAQLAWVNEKGVEYIIPNDMLQIPAVANMVNIIESMRTAKGYASGSFTDSVTSIPSFSNPSSTNTAMNVQFPPEFQQAMTLFVDAVRNGIPVYFGGAEWRKFGDDFKDYNDSNAQSLI